MTTDQIQALYDELWRSSVMTLDGNNLEDMINEDMADEDIEDCQAQFFISLQNCALLGPFAYSDDDAVKKAKLLSRDKNYIWAFAK